MSKLTAAGALAALSRGADFARLLQRPSFDVSIYKPEGVDRQTPHLRDELYVIAAGSGRFICGAESETLAPGDIFFVESGVEHRFVEFSRDFATWVVFFGQRGELNR